MALVGEYLKRKESEMSSNEKDLNEHCVFIPVSNNVLFKTCDMYAGFNVCLCIDGGIVVTKEYEEEYRKMVREFEENNS